MNEDQRAGTLVILVSVVLIAVALICSHGWGTTVELFLFEFTLDFNSDGFRDPDNIFHVVVWTKYVLAVLIVGAGYGIARYLSLIAPIFRRKARPFSRAGEEELKRTS